MKHATRLALLLALAFAAPGSAAEDLFTFVNDGISGYSYILFNEDLSSFSFKSDWHALGNASKIGYVVYPAGMSEIDFPAYIEANANNPEFGKKINGGVVDLGARQAGDRIGFYEVSPTGVTCTRTAFKEWKDKLWLSFDTRDGSDKDELMSIDDITAVPAGGGVSYLDPTAKDANGNPSNRVCKVYAPYAGENTLTSGWYVVLGVITNGTRIVVSGDANLILFDGAELVAQKGIEVAAAGGVTNSLTIWAQCDATATNSPAGRLTAIGGVAAAGIGGGSNGGGTITINGGTVTATGGNAAAGIGGGSNRGGGTITIRNAIVTATGGRDGAGIGGGDNGGGGTITIKNAIVTATGDRQGAGIGGGGYGAAETIVIKGGTVTATGGAAGGAGIGGGFTGGGGAITIENADVTATGGNGAGNGGGAGIGGGAIANGGTTVIVGGRVTAIGGRNDTGGGAGIGGGRNTSKQVGAGGTIILENADVTAIGALGGAGIGGGKGGPGGRVVINGGRVTAVGSANDNGFSMCIGGGIDNAGVVDDAGSLLLIPGTKAGVVSELGTANESVDWRPDGDQETLCQNTNGIAVRIEACFPHQDGDEDDFCDLCGLRCNPIPYWDPAGGGTTNVCASYTPYFGQDTLTSGWYVVDGVFPDVARIAVSGDVNLLLMDHAELFATNGIRVAAEGGVTNRLTIWAQSDATAANSPAGRLVATGTDVCAGIGGDREHPDAGAITVNGGVVLASGVGPFKVSGADAGQLTDLRMASGGYALGNKWYYGIHAYADGFGGLQYAITVYSDSARTNAVATSEKMLGGGSLEMRRSIVITDPYAMGAAAYDYTTTTNEATGEFILNILDDTGAIAAKAVGAAGANCNIVAANGGANIGTVTFGLTDMTAGDTGTIYMANMRWGWNLPAGGTTIPMATTVQGRARARNNGIGVYGAKIAFDGSVHLGDSPTTGTDSPSYGTFDACGSGAGVGGGFNGSGGMVAIAGGAARAIACENGEAVGHGRNGADAGALSMDGIRVGCVGDDGEVHDWASVDERDDHCRNTNGVAVRLEVCFPHEFGGTDCKRCGAPAPTVSDVVARQRWPWNGYVDVDYELGGTTKGFAARISFAEQGGAGRVWVATNFLADARPSAEPGFHRATWDAKADGATNVIAEAVTATVELVREE